MEVFRKLPWATYACKAEAFWRRRFGAWGMTESEWQLAVLSQTSACNSRDREASAEAEGAAFERLHGYCWYVVYLLYYLLLQVRTYLTTAGT